MSTFTIQRRVIAPKIVANGAAAPAQQGTSKARAEADQCSGDKSIRALIAKEKIIDDPILQCPASSGPHESFVCSLGLELAYDFMLRSHVDAQTTNSNGSSSSSSSNTSALRRIIALRTRSQSSGAELPISCKHCDFRTESRIVLDTHLAEPHLNVDADNTHKTRPWLTCNFCLEQSAANVSSADNDSDDSRANFMYSYRQRSSSVFKTRSRLEYRAHLLVNHGVYARLHQIPRPFACDTCSFDTNNKRGYLEHYSLLCAFRDRSGGSGGGGDGGGPSSGSDNDKSCSQRIVELSAIDCNSMHKNNSKKRNALVDESDSSDGGNDDNDDDNDNNTNNNNDNNVHAVAYKRCLSAANFNGADRPPAKKKKKSEATECARFVLANLQAPAHFDTLHYAFIFNRKLATTAATATSRELVSTALNPSASSFSSANNIYKSHLDKFLDDSTLTFEVKTMEALVNEQRELDELRQQQQQQQQQQKQQQQQNQQAFSVQVQQTVQNQQKQQKQHQEQQQQKQQQQLNQEQELFPPLKVTCQLCSMKFIGNVQMSSFVKHLELFHNIVNPLQLNVFLNKHYFPQIIAYQHEKQKHDEQQQKQQQQQAALQRLVEAGSFQQSGTFKTQLIQLCSNGSNQLFPTASAATTKATTSAATAAETHGYNAPVVDSAPITSICSEGLQTLLNVQLEKDNTLNTLKRLGRLQNKQHAAAAAVSTTEFFSKCLTEIEVLFGRCYMCDLSHKNSSNGIERAGDAHTHNHGNHGAAAAAAPTSSCLLYSDLLKHMAERHMMSLRTAALSLRCIICGAAEATRDNLLLHHFDKHQIVVAVTHNKLYSLNKQPSALNVLAPIVSGAGVPTAAVVVAAAASPLTTPANTPTETTTPATTSATTTTPATTRPTQSTVVYVVDDKAPALAPASASALTFGAATAPATTATASASPLPLRIGNMIASAHHHGQQKSMLNMIRTTKGNATVLTYLNQVRQQPDGGTVRTTTARAPLRVSLSSSNLASIMPKLMTIAKAPKSNCISSNGSSSNNGSSSSSNKTTLLHAPTVILLTQSAAGNQQHQGQNSDEEGTLGANHCISVQKLNESATEVNDRSVGETTQALPNANANAHTINVVDDDDDDVQIVEVTHATSPIAAATATAAAAQAAPEAAAKSSVKKKSERSRVQTFKCLKCAKKYSKSSHLVIHVRRAHVTADELLKTPLSVKLLVDQHTKSLSAEKRYKADASARKLQQVPLFEIDITRDQENDNDDSGGERPQLTEYVATAAAAASAASAAASAAAVATDAAGADTAEASSASKAVVRGANKIACFFCQQVFLLSERAYEQHLLQHHMKTPHVHIVRLSLTPPETKAASEEIQSHPVVSISGQDHSINGYFQKLADRRSSKRISHSSQPDE